MRDLMWREARRRALRQWAAGVFVVLWIGALVIACMVTLSGCPRPPITTYQRDAFTSARAGWQAAGNRDPGPCLAGARVKRAESVTEFRTRCYLYGAYAHVKAAACLSRYARGMFGQRDGVLVLIAPGFEPHAYTIVHEAMHALVKCTKLGPEGDPFDAAHSLPTVWTAAGREGSAQHLSGVEHP